ncbi:hypothetical protein J1605_009147 [Eschrichtius robustus]|uniref:Uncharacterized protein n=1 Tax=Eschrichtius robustus TaxID=9764 RepID=A0AB34GWW5_ESCRO|nr:hypothetical protein J1605_009147 [Eschrichtius robustus]
MCSFPRRKPTPPPARGSAVSSGGGLQLPRPGTLPAAEGSLRQARGPQVGGGGARGSRGLPVSTIVDVDRVAGSAPGPGSSVPGVWTGPRRSRASGTPTSDRPGLSPVLGGPAKPKAGPHHATFV